MTDVPARWQWLLNETEHCNKCGFCLPACPTYRLTGEEIHSPRGRIALVEASVRGELAPGAEALGTALSHCIGCRACETACPSGVHYERILEGGRQIAEEAGSKAFGASLMSRAALRVAKHPAWFRRAVAAGRLAVRIPGLGSWAAFLPPPAKTEELGGEEAAGSRPLPVVFFSGCVMEAIFSDANAHAIKLLQTAGASVTVLAGQTCCGAIHFHSGRVDEARALARRNIAAFEASSAECIANTAGGCGAMLSEYPRLLADDPAWAARAEAFAGRVRDLATLLRDPRLRPLTYQGAGDRVVLQNSCHLVNVQHAGDDPLQLLQDVPGDTLLRYPEQDLCCGSGGLYNLNQPAFATAILDRKMAQIRPLKPTRVVVNNPGCHLQMLAGVRRNPDLGEIPVEHLATYLWRCYRRTAAGSPTTPAVP